MGSWNVHIHIRKCGYMRVIAQSIAREDHSQYAHKIYLWILLKYSLQIKACLYTQWQEKVCEPPLELSSFLH